MRRVLAERVAELSFRPVLADSSEAAMIELQRAKAAGEPYSVILADATSPGSNGFALAAQVREAPGLAGAVVLLLSSSNPQLATERCREVGAAYLRKPVRRIDLIQALRRVTDPEKYAGLQIAAGRPSHRAEVDEGPRFHILLVEDNAFNQRVATMKLERKGHKVLVVGNGADALAALEKDRFDLMLTDIQMPDMDGFELVTKVRHREVTPGHRLPVIAMTAHAMKGDRERCLASGMDGYVAKPIHDAELWEQIRLVTGGSTNSVVTRPASVTETSEKPLFDMAEILARVGGDMSAVRELVDIFDADYHPLMSDIVTAVRDGDAPKLRIAAHTLKGMVAFFAAGRATAAAYALERLGETGNLTGAESEVAVLASDIAELTPILRSLSSSPINESSRF